MSKPSNIKSWTFLILGLLGTAMYVQELDHGIATGRFFYQFALFAGRFSFVGITALVMQICSIIVSFALAFFGYCGIKKSSDGA